MYIIPSAHETLEKDESSEHKYVGYIVKAGGITIYHSEDTCPYDGLVERLRKWTIDIALLPINGRDPDYGIKGNFTVKEATLLGQDIQARLVIPCHYEMFEFNTVLPQEFILLVQTYKVPYKILNSGERLSIL